jgi:beta-lactamase superfamily II metal-dependent hydrolase
MEIRIFDVEHGFYAYIVADNANVMLIDCGHNSEIGFRPSSYLLVNGCYGIEELIISNYDENHLRDLLNYQERDCLE